MLFQGVNSVSVHKDMVAGLPSVRYHLIHFPLLSPYCEGIVPKTNMDVAKRERIGANPLLTGCESYARTSYGAPHIFFVILVSKTF